MQYPDPLDESSMRSFLGIRVLHYTGDFLGRGLQALVSQAESAEIHLPPNLNLLPGELHVALPRRLQEVPQLGEHLLLRRGLDEAVIHALHAVDAPHHLVRSPAPGWARVTAPHSSSCKMHVLGAFSCW